MLREDKLDLVFIIGPVNEPNIHSAPLCTYQVDWVANPKIFDCEREIDIMDLSRMPIILTGQESSGYGIVVEYFRTYDINNIPSNDRNIILDCVYSLGTAAHLVRSGLGIMVLPLFIFDDDLRDRRVSTVNVRQKLPPFYMTACYKFPVANRLIERLTEVAQEAAAEFTETCNPKYCWV
jgi:DNA-binding transcriptional LysR family regulator